MKRWMTWTVGICGAMLVTATALFTPACTCGPRAQRAHVVRKSIIEETAYHGWKALRLTSETAEVVVVPEIGRVMSFRLRGGENVFWEDHSLDGKRGDASGRDWVNFGGDKTWPAPEGDWGKHTGYKQWMPPPAFDSMPVEGRIVINTVVLTSPVDPFYGVRTVRRISLSESSLFITTKYERVSGEPFKIGIWTITQFKDPAAVLVPLKKNSVFTNGYYAFDDKPWLQLQRKASHLEITRDPKTPHKMGCDARMLMWVGEKEVCTVSMSAQGGTEYPDRGASAEVYTNPDPKKYVELEMLGPLATLKAGESINATSRYDLRKRTAANPAAEFPAWMQQ